MNIYIAIFVKQQNNYRKKKRQYLIDVVNFHDWRKKCQGILEF